MIQPLGILFLKGALLSETYAFSSTYLIILLALLPHRTGAAAKSR